MTTENRKLDMSLDDIIQMDGIKGPRRFNNNNNNNGQTRRRFNGGNSGGDRRGRYEPKRLNNGPYHRNRSSGGSGQYSNNRLGGGRRQMNGFGGGGGNRRNATLHVSNLAYSVNTEDIEELFSTFGTLVRSTVHYDQYGTSLGTADVVFENRTEAIEARNKLNSVPLDNKPLRITMIDEDERDSNDPFSNYLRSSNQRENQQKRNGLNRNYNNNRNNNRSGGGGGGGNRPNGSGRRGPPPSVDDLDREMDEWRMQIDQDNKEDDTNAAEEGEFDI